MKNLKFLICLYLIALSFSWAALAFAQGSPSTATPSTDIGAYQLEIPLFNYSQSPNIVDYIKTVYMYSMIIIVPLVVIVIIIGGIEWIMSAGDSGKIQKARERIISGFVGLGLALGSYLILALFGLNVLVNPNPQYIAANPDEELNQYRLSYGPPVPGGNPGKTTKDVCNNIINKPDLVNAYKSAESQTGVPWQILASIHYLENTNATTPPTTNNAGPMQVMSEPYASQPGCKTWPGCLLCASNLIKTYKTKDPITILCRYNGASMTNGDCPQSEYVHNDPDNGVIMTIKQKGLPSVPDKRPGALTVYKSLMNNCQ